MFFSTRIELIGTDCTQKNVEVSIAFETTPRIQNKRLKRKNSISKHYSASQEIPNKHMCVLYISNA